MLHGSAEPLVIGSDYSRHPMPGQLVLPLDAAGERNVIPHADTCACKRCMLDIATKHGDRDMVRDLLTHY
jgi:hypothetical protein